MVIYIKLFDVLFLKIDSCIPIRQETGTNVVIRRIGLGRIFHHVLQLKSNLERVFLAEAHSTHTTGSLPGGLT